MHSWLSDYKSSGQAAPFRSVLSYFKRFMRDKNHKNECWQKINFELLMSVAALATFMR